MSTTSCTSAGLKEPTAAGRAPWAGGREGERVEAQGAPPGPGTDLPGPGPRLRQQSLAGAHGGRPEAAPTLALAHPRTAGPGTGRRCSRPR